MSRTSSSSDKPAVERHADIEIGDIAFGDQHGGADIDLRRPGVRDLLVHVAGAQRGHRLLQHVLIKLDADLADMAGLFVAQQIAGAANIEIVARHREARAQIVQRLQHLQPALRALSVSLRSGGVVR